MTDKVEKAKPKLKQEPPRWRLFVLLGVLLILIVIGLRWGVMHYMVSAGQIAIKQRDLNSAESWFRRASYWGEDNGSVAFYRARLARVQGDLENAQLLLEVAAQQGYNRSAIQREKAMNMAQLGEPGPLMQDLHRIMADDTVDPGEVMCSTIAGLERNGELGEAFQVLDFWMAADLEDARMHYHRGRLHKLVNEWEPAENSLSRAVQLAPYWHTARVLLGEVLVQSGKLDDARQQFNLVLASVPDDFNATIGRASVLVKEQHYDEAIASLERLESQDAKDYRLNLLFAECAQAKGNHELAVSRLTRLFPEFENDLEVNQALLKSYLVLDKKQEIETLEEKIAQGKTSLEKQKEFLKEVDKELGNDYDWLMMCADTVAPYQLQAALPFLSKASHIKMTAPEPQRYLVKYYEQIGDTVMADSVRKTLRKINLVSQAKAKQAIIEAEQAKASKAAEDQ